jgi:hypothetical protein
MRRSLGSVVLLAAAISTAYAFWPANEAVQGPPLVVAQDKSPAAKPRAAGNSQKQSDLQHAAAPAHVLSSDVGQSPQIEAALEANVDWSIDTQPLMDAMELISRRFKIPILLDEKALQDASIDPSTEVHQEIRGIKLRQALILMLDRLPQPLRYEIREGVLWITTAEKIKDDLVVIVYDCRDLVSLHSLLPRAKEQPWRGGGMGGGKGTSGGAMLGVAPGDAAQQRPAPAAKPSTPTSSSAAPSREQEEAPLIRIIKRAGTVDDWSDEEGQERTIVELGGLIVVRQNPMVHEEIKRILADLRRMIKEGAFAPPGTAPAQAGPTPASANSGP